MNLQNRERLTDLENEHMVVGGRMGGRDREFGKDMYTLLCLKWITSKDLLYSTWNSAQCYVAVWKGGEFGSQGQGSLVGCRLWGRTESDMTEAT